MRVQYNQGLFTQNRYNQTNTELNKTLNKLSSGYKINTAADDAAGLSISEKMRAQIRGLEMVEKNVLDGTSLVQVADAGLAEIQNPNLIRMRELAIQASNDTLTDDDRGLIQKEINQIIQGIDDIATNTEFNTIKPLCQEAIIEYTEIDGSSTNALNKYLSLHVTEDGSFDLRTNLGYPGSSNDDHQILIYGSGNGTTQPSLLLNGSSQRLKTSILEPTTVSNGVFKTVYKINDVTVAQYVSLAEDQFEFKYEVKNTATAPQSVGFYFHMDTMLGNDDAAPFIVDQQILTNEKSYQGTDLPSSFEVFNNTGNPELKIKGKVTGDGIIQAPDELRIGHYNRISNPTWTPTNELVGDSGYALKWNEQILAPGESFEVNTFYGLGIPPSITESVWTPSTWMVPTAMPQNLVLQVGPNFGQHFNVELTDARTTAMGINNVNMTTREQAEASLQRIDEAVSFVSQERAKYGAYQNALSHIGQNVSSARENLTKAESTLRDADIAKESIKLSKDQILLQSSQSMMAQINQMSQGILELLG